MSGAYFGPTVMATANARTESEYRHDVIEGLVVESVRRGVHNTDYMAWINGNRAIWGAGSSRGEAINSAMSNARSHGVQPLPSEQDGLRLALVKLDSVLQHWRGRDAGAAWYSDLQTARDRIHEQLLKLGAAS